MAEGVAAEWFAYMRARIAEGAQHLAEESAARFSSSDAAPLSDAAPPPRREADVVI